MSRQEQNFSLETVQKQFENWRKTRQHRSPIPEELWQAAISLCADQSIYEISKTLKLSYTKLKERVSAKKAPALSESSPHPGFVALDLGHPLSAQYCLIEMEEKNGTKMRIQIDGGSGFDLMELVQFFWTKRS